MAGDLMYSHASEAAKPLPCSVPFAVILGATYAPKIMQTTAAPRNINKATNALEDFSGEYTGKKPKRVYKTDAGLTDRYRSVLSKDKFISTKVIAEELGIRYETVNIYLGSKWDLVEKIKRQNAKGHTVNYWILK